MQYDGNSVLFFTFVMRGCESYRMRFVAMMCSFSLVVVNNNNYIYEYHCISFHTLGRFWQFGA